MRSPSFAKPCFSATDISVSAVFKASLAAFKITSPRLARISKLETNCFKILEPLIKNKAVMNKPFCTGLNAIPSTNP